VIEEHRHARGAFGQEQTIEEALGIQRINQTYQFGVQASFEVAEIYHRPQ
jgi:hypothetical protein